MIFELVVTSAKRALQAGRSGFAPVMRTRGIHPDLQSRLEAISGYRHLYPQGDPRNPVIRSHCVLESAAGRFSALSRLLDAGSDYSGRSNKLAHHIACDANEVRSGLCSSPAAVMTLLEKSDVFMSRWEDEPQEKPAFEPFPYPPVSPAKCVAWERLAGDAGWAGVLAERTLKATPTWIVVGANVDVLPLYAEALALMEPAKRWGVSFTTHALSDKGFLWKAAVDGSAEAKAAREQPNAALIDLTMPATVTEVGPYIQAARGLADVPWKPRTEVPNTPATDSPRVSIPTPAGPRVDLPPAVRPNDVASAPPSKRAGPPQLVTPPPIARARGAAPTALPIPLDRDSTPSSRVPLIATSILAAALLATCLGLFVDHRMRGDASIVRQIALALPPNEEPPKPSKHTGQGGESLAHGEQVKTGGDSTKTDKAGSDKPDDSHAHTNVPTPEGDKPAEHASAVPPESKNGAPSEKSPPPQPAAEMPKDPSAAPSPEKDKTTPTPTPTAAPKESPLSFADFRKLVEKAQHLPAQAIGVSRPDAGSEAAAPVPLITFEPAKSVPTDVQLHIIQQKSEGGNSPAQLLLHDLEVDGDRHSWKCCLDSNDKKPVGSFELSPQGLSFVTAEQLSSDTLAQLAACCLLLRGVKPDECTYLQLSRPTYIPPLKLPLHQSEKAPRALLEADAEITSPIALKLFETIPGGHLSLTVTLACPKAKMSTATSSGTVSLPIVIRTYLDLPLSAGPVYAPCDLVLSRHSNGICAKALVNAFSDVSLFDRLRGPFEKKTNVNFEYFWQFARQELNAVFLSQDGSSSAESHQNRKPLVFETLKAKLSPADGKQGAPFKTYTEALRSDILSSAALTKAAEAAVDARHQPPSPPPPNASDKEGAAQPPSAAKSVERDAAIAKEKEAGFEAWCNVRLNEFERLRSSKGSGGPDSWPQADQDDYAALFLWHRIHRLEEVLAALPKDADSPITIPAEARVELKLVWPQSLLPEGASFRPETVLLQTKP